MISRRQISRIISGVSWGWLTACLMLTTPAEAEEECVTRSKSSADSQCIVMSLDGKSGAWLALPRLEAVTAAYALAPAVAAQLDAQRALAETRGQEAAQWQAAAVARAHEAYQQTQIAEQTAAAAKAASDALASEQARSAAWYRSPWLWFGVGAALGAGSVTALALAVSR